ncbi:MAG: ADP-ribosylglycohydrolase family protein [Cytophagales bacterium]|nr:ADP-ribosylglycohydrolase family protein [Armatimonadota bacterium]
MKNISRSFGEKRAASGCLFGLALGDALAAPVEFIRDTRHIVAVYGPSGPAAPEGNPALVTDDTQMALAVGEALVTTQPPFTAAALEGPLREAFVAWLIHPDNNRAPGNTCLMACRNLQRGQVWQQATVPGSKGCGANMRVAPVGLLPRTDPETRAGIAQFQAALTHGHPTALAASDLTAFAITDLARGDEPAAALPSRLRAYAESQREIYREEWLGSLWQRPGLTSPRDFIARGWEECLETLDRLDAALSHPDRDTDPCLATGEGWIAEEAFATGLLCFLLYPDDPVAALRHATVTSGDSDSIACLAGAFAGAHHGVSAWPEEWCERIEYRERLAALGTHWDGGLG